MFKDRFDYIDFRLGDLDDAMIKAEEFWTKTINGAKIWYQTLSQKLEEIKKSICDTKDEVQKQTDAIDGIFNYQNYLYEHLKNVYYIQEQMANNDIKALRETQLSAYEDLVKLSADNRKFKTKIEDIISRVESYCKSTEYITNLEQENLRLQKENESLRIRNVELEKLEKKMISEVSSLADSFAMVAQGIYNQENIEFAAVKTYRDGWKYICYNGRQLTNFDDIEYLGIDYYPGERLKMDIDFK